MNKAKLPMAYINKTLSTKTLKAYNASYKDFNIILEPVIQRPSGALTYTWRFTYQQSYDHSPVFDSKQAALKDAVEYVNIKLTNRRRKNEQS